MEHREGPSALETGCDTLGMSPQKIYAPPLQRTCHSLSQPGELCLGPLARSSTQLSKIQMEVSPQPLWKTGLPFLERAASVAVWWGLIVFP